MKILKNILATLLISVMALSVIGCHKKNEIAVTIDGFEFTSAYYMCALLNANGEAQNEVYSKLSAEEQQKEVDFYSKKIDGKKYTDWVKDRAIETLKEIAAYKSLSKKAKLKLDDETINNAKFYASYYWASYGYQQYFEPNGVSEATYTNYMVDSYYSNLYFDHLYGKDGEKEIAAKKIETKLYDNFIIANMLEVTFSEETDKEKKEIKTKFEKYTEDLKNGKRSFEEIYKEYHKIKDETKKDETDKDKTESKEDKPLDQYATVLGASGTGYENDNYKTVKKMKTGEVKLIEKDDKAGYIIAVKKDIKADKYYLKNLDSTVRHMIADDEYQEFIQKTAKGLKAKINKYAVNQFKVKNIVEPSYQ